MTDWHIEPLDKRRACLKRRRSAACEPQPLDTLPTDWRELLAFWVKRGGNSRWETLRNDAGVNRVQMAADLLDWLLRAGWAAVIEHHELGDWWPQRVELLHQPQLRAVLGLPDKDIETQRWQQIRAQLSSFADGALSPALASLDELPAARALARQDLIFKLHDWKAQQQSGTRRDFALFARGGTKTVTEAEWNWLESLIDLADFNIERHTPLLLVAAPLTLITPQGRMDLAACPDFAALTPATLAAATAVMGQVSHWHLIENRTSFERMARNREPNACIVWLPGFPPAWWREAMGRLLDFIPASALISCDPDPAGVSIALMGAKLWYERGLEWLPWKMTASDLAALPARKPLSEADKQYIASLQSNPMLPPILSELVEWMEQHAEKGEQEGFL